MTSAHATSIPIATQVDELLQRLGVPRSAYTGGELAVRSPITGETIAHVRQTTTAEADCRHRPRPQRLPGLATGAGAASR